MTLQKIVTPTPPDATSPVRDPLRVVACSRPWPLDGSRGGWLVESGHVDLFGMVITDGEPAGMRTPLCQVAPGELFLGVPAGAGHTILAVGRPGARVTPLERDDLEGSPTDWLAGLVEAWIARLAAATFGEAPLWPELAGEAGQRLELAPGQRLCGARGVVWAIAREGRLRIGHGGEAPATMPLAGGLSLQAITESRIELVDTGAALGAGLDVLDGFHRAALAAIGARIAEGEQRARQRLAARSAANRRSLRSGLQQMAAAVGRPAAQPAHAAAAHPAVGAFAAVAAHLGIALPRQPRPDAGVEAAWTALARANGIGLRRVLLRGAWWRTDSGPLLARRSEGDGPVALLPQPGGGYLLWDPEDGSSRRVDAAVAAAIAPAAKMLYRPIPGETRGIAGLLAFAWRGTGRELWMIAAMAVLSGAVAGLFPAAVGVLLGSAVPRADAHEVFAVIAGLALAGLGAIAFDFAKAMALVRLQGRLETALQPGLMHRLMALPVSFFRGFGTGDLTNRVLSIQAVRRVLADNSLISLLAAISAGVSFLVMLLYSPLLALVAGGLVLVAALVAGALALGELRHDRAQLQLRGQEEGLVLQMLQGIAKLRVSGSEARLFAVWAGLFARQKRHFAAAQRFAAASANFTETYAILALMTVFLTAARLLQPEDGAAALGLGAFLAVNAAFGQLLAATTTLTRALAANLAVVPLFERVRPIMAAVPEMRADNKDPGSLSGRVELVRVSFRYPGTNRPVLEELSLRIEPGSFVAVVGPSGSGKSTLLRLLLGFETPTSGDILFDGQSLSTLDASALRRQVGVVLQNGRINTGTIFENITNGLPYSLEEARAAARLAQIEAEIDAMPMGMHTLLIEGSSTLSGGQRQRLMIARALIGRPRILLFDEATSALDNRSQAIVTHALERLHTTRVVVAHRLSTIERADCIFVLEGGRLVESGRYDELMVSNGLFSRMARRQIL
jgi:NHLM bacteriocin system ABC transporter ATP-binding protein